MGVERRRFGQNLSVIMSQRNITVSDMAKRMGYSDSEMMRIIESRLYVNRDEKEAFANELRVPLEAFENECNDQELVSSGYMECRGNFSTIENREKIIDIFDAYCDIQELVRDTEDVDGI